LIFLAGVAAVLAMTLMGLAFVVARRIRNFSIVDIAWSFNFTPIAASAALLGSGLPGRRLLVFSMVALWSLRLSAHLARRVAALHPAEEGRYIELRRQWADNVDGRFFRFFLLQGLLNAGLSTPFMFAALNPSPALAAVEILGVLVFAISLVGEALADAQLNAFRKDPESAGKVCRLGLWRYSRHPNYFFEWLVWCAYALIASAAPWGWISWFCPALMLYFLLKVTGIKATEEQAVRSRGDAYRQYQATTSAFVPWFPRPDARKTVTIK
jgi:steroid 5-alpha reductase family enzyme